MSSQIADELLVTIRFRSAKTVIKMNDREHNSQLRAKFQQHSKQRDRICAARNGHANAVSGAEKVLLANVMKDGLGEVMHVATISIMRIMQYQLRLQGKALKT